MGATHSPSPTLACTLCGKALNVDAQTGPVSCAYCGRSHAVIRTVRTDGSTSVTLDHPDLPGEREQRAGSANLVGLLFIGLLLAAAGVLGARALLRAQLLVPDCQAACSAAGLEYAEIATRQGRRYGPSYFRSADTCLCALGPTASVPPRCSAALSDSAACDAGFWFASGRWAITAGVTLMTGMLLFVPVAVVALWRWRRRRRRAR